MKLWRENKINQEYSLSNQEIIKQFKNSKFYNQTEPNFRNFLNFLTSPHGLNSTFDSKDFDKLWEDYINKK